MGTVVRVLRRGGGARLEVRAPQVVAEVKTGDSVAVNGSCVTVTGRFEDTFACDLVPETLARTNLGTLQPGEEVNLEMPLRASSRLDGHIVQGHVDGTGRVEELARDRDDVRMRVRCDSEITRYLVPKGSVAIDGVSLTVVAVSDGGLDVALIPHTLAATNLGDRRPGDRVNLEADVLGKYVVRYLERTRHGA
jgi:riboflavin synthase